MSSLQINDSEKLEEIEGVFFDKDGTIIDIHFYWSSMIKLRASLISKKWFNNNSKEIIEESLVDLMGVDLKSDKIKPNGPVGILPRTSIAQIVVDFVNKKNINVTTNDIEIIFKEVDMISLKSISSFLKLLPGVKELLINLYANNVPSIIVSTDITERARIAMESLNIDKYFLKIYGGDSVQNPKPAPDLALLAINEFDLNNKRIALIGDHPFDIKMGRNANLGLNIGVLTGMSNMSAFKKLDCDIVENLNQIDVR